MAMGNIRGANSFMLIASPVKGALSVLGDEEKAVDA